MVIESVSDRMPVTLLAAENEPIRSGRAAYRRSSSARCEVSMCPWASARIRTTSAIVSRQEISFEWCSNGPTKTTGRWSAGMCEESDQRVSRSDGILRLRIPTSLSTAAVAPEPQKITAVSSAAPIDVLMTWRASSRSLVVCSPVPLASVCVLA